MTSSEEFGHANEPFKIAVCGLFQTGKSTTINAMANGREICADSKISGIRTSACNVYIRGAEQEHCRIELFDDDEICDRLGRALHLEIVNADLWKHHRREILWNELREMWADDPKGAEREQLEGATLLLSGLGYLPSLRRTIRDSSLEDAACFGKAPNDELLRWTRIRRLIKEAEGGDFKNALQEEFPVHEVLYPFVKKISMRINSSWLKGSNLCIIDTPGLSVNSRDTETALSAIRKADAIMYIFSGNTEPKEMERQFLYRLGDLAGTRPVLFAVNWHHRLRDAVLEALGAVLSEGGYESKLVTYNARLALRAEQGARLLEKRRGD